MDFIKITLPIELAENLSINMKNEGYDSVEEYIKAALNKIVDNERILNTFPLAIKKLEEIEPGDVFSIIDLIGGKSVSLPSIFLLQEMDDLLMKYLTNVICNVNYELLMWDQTTFVNRYIKLPK